MDDTFDYIMEEYTLPATIVPLVGWDMADLVSLSHQINAELQRRYSIREKAFANEAVL